MKSIKSGMTENQAQAILESELLKDGAKHTAYGSIVASGKNGAILHYHENNSKLKNKDLLLIDAGCEWEGYASDITRTFPVSGKFTSKQKEIYNIVLKTQKECIKMIKPGVTMYDIHFTACRLIQNGLVELGIIKKLDESDLFDKKAYSIFFPHGIGHLIGLDVHDVGAKPSKNKKRKAKNLRAQLKLEKDMCITIEPGIYFIEAYFDSKEHRKKTSSYINWNIADKYRDVGGIRIEDDLIVTAKGSKNLTKVPKEINAIERLMN
ncbi:hypothetical protein BVY03_00955 [bacterium K02(2017)]|nr:hypothetical protein BVY03_00955 [bacterium K02(2017)]